MWKFASRCLAGSGAHRFKTGFRKLTRCIQESSDDESSSTISKDDGLECPICCESFNIVENIPYVLWCGHSLCKNCVLSLPWAIVKMHPLPIQLPLLISCPWCNLLSPRVVLKGTLKFPRKNYFLLWMVERINTNKSKHQARVDDSCGDCGLTSESQLSDCSNVQLTGPANHAVGMKSYIRRALFLFVEMTAKFPLVIMFLVIVLYAIPASAVIVVLHILITLLVAIPSFLVLYFSYPNLDWLVREIVA